ncbi:hypothetical protein [Anaerotruncus rubiinfantis]|uniref:hypothetical protein n=1 Tax=Anaerotruncus rubiinfantis TaxID=1720200 RepID=UPI0011C71654|nr:hypothetical protein [Anaerotruncus rubiinfantis]
MSNLMIPRPIIEKAEKLCQIAEQYPETVPVPVAADYFSTAQESLRCALEQGRVPFGWAWKKNVRGNRGFIIPTVKMFCWTANINPFQIVEDYIK